MLYQKKGDTVLDSGKVFTVGGEVFANHACDYEGLFGTVTEIRTGPDQCAEQGAPDICCAFQPPESRAMVEDIQERFGHLVNAFQYGAPPHGGLAYGLDRLVMLMAGADSIRDVIAFPKVQNASEPMTQCPDFVDDKQLDELSINVTRKEAPEENA